MTELEADGRPLWLGESEWFEHEDAGDAHPRPGHRVGTTSSWATPEHAATSSAPSFGRIQTSGLLVAFTVPQLGWLLVLAYFVREAL